MGLGGFELKRISRFELEFLIADFEQQTAPHYVTGLFGRCRLHIATFRSWHQARERKDHLVFQVRRQELVGNPRRKAERTPAFAVDDKFALTRGRYFLRSKKMANSNIERQADLMKRIHRKRGFIALNLADETDREVAQASQVSQAHFARPLKRRHHLAWVLRERALPKSPLGKACDYLLAHWKPA